MEEKNAGKTNQDITYYHCISRYFDNDITYMRGDNGNPVCQGDRGGQPSSGREGTAAGGSGNAGFVGGCGG